MKLRVRNLICNTCIQYIENHLKESGLPIICVNPGEVVLNYNITTSDITQVKRILAEYNYEIITAKDVRLVEDIKLLVLEQLYSTDGAMELHYSDFISERLGLSYTYLSILFAQITGNTIQNYFITERAELAKTYIRYGDLPFKDICLKLGYRSIPHFSASFTQVVGITPEEYRRRIQTP